jgi:CheY-like chemotaxis protein
MKTLLLVEDDEDLRDVVRDALQNDARRVLEAEHGRDALELIDKHGLPDLILLDMNMPIMNGWQFAQELRDRQLWRVPVVVLTAAHDALRSAQEIGAAGFLGKPFDMSSLYSVVDRHLNETGGMSPLPASH